ncbi:MAG: SpoIIE family protein phosphatase [Bacteroidales bacterium]|nr:SpoIIE family protein phosphatase [Bacteroidales bacterium]
MNNKMRLIIAIITFIIATLSSSVSAQRHNSRASNMYKTLVYTCDSARYDKDNTYKHAHKAVILANRLIQEASKNNDIVLDSVVFYKSEGLYYMGRFYLDLGENTSNFHYYQLANNYFREVISARQKMVRATDFTEIINYWALSMERTNKLDSAIIIYKNNIETCKSFGNIRSMAMAHQRLGGIYFRSKKYTESETALMNALRIRLITGERDNIANTHIDLGELYIAMGDLDKAFLHIDRAITISSDNRAINTLLTALRASYNIAKERKDEAGALKFLEHEVSIRDSLNDSRRSSEAYNKEMLYQIKLKESQIEVLEMQNELDSIHIQQFNEDSEKLTQSFIILVVFIIVSIWFAIYYLVQYRKKKRYIASLEANNITINKQKEELAIQRDKYAVIQESVMDSRRYASKIQMKVMTGAKDTTSVFPLSFVFYKPKEIVSGDFYYIKQINNYKIAAVADCTGHGTPAALLSILYIGFLNEELSQIPIPHANDILEALRSRIKDTLNSQNSNDTVLDGCDMGIIIYDELTQKLEFAGANIDMFISHHSDKQSKIEQEIEILKGTKNPLGWFLKEQLFNCYDIPVRDGDTIYLMSDGYKDQIGKDGTFGGIRIKRLLSRIARLPVNEQRREVQSTFSAWMDSFEQVDDVTLLGIKFHNKPSSLE